MNKKNVASVFALLVAMVAIAPAANSTVISTGVIEISSPYRGGYSFDFEILGLSVNGIVDESAWSISEGYAGDSFTGNISKAACYFPVQ